MSAHSFDRRSLLSGAGGAAALVAGGAVLSGCSNGKSTTTSSNEGSSSNGGNEIKQNAKVQLPTFQRYTGVPFDLKPTKAGVDAAWRHFPSKNPKSVDDVPGDGSTVTGMTLIYTAIPPTAPKNKWWVGLNKKLNCTLEMQMVPQSDYTTKFATVIAGNDLPDLLQFRGTVQNMPDLLKAKFADLTEYLSGDAIKDYPNLANVPTPPWKSAVYNGGIYGVPVPRDAIGTYNFCRADLFKKAGVSLSPKGYDELVETTKALTDAKNRHWALGSIGEVQGVFQRMNNEPNGWREEGGKLISRYESDEYKQSLSDIIKMWKSGVIHPQSFSTTIPFKQLFNGGQVAINAADGDAGWTQYITDNLDNPGFELGLMLSYDRQGKGLSDWPLGSGLFSFTALKKADPKRLKMLLRVLNWMAAPFGTEEYLYRLYGKEGRDHTMSSAGDPVLTKSGLTDAQVTVRYLADAPQIVYQPGRPKDAVTQHDYQSKEVPHGVVNPTVGLFSNTEATKNAVADKNFNDGVHQILQGRQPMSTLDDLLDKWRKQAGDGMRQEFQDQIQKQGGTNS